VRIVDQAVEDGVGQGGIADHVMPAIHRQLAGDQGRAAPVPVLYDVEQIAALLGPERFGSRPQSSSTSSLTPPRARISRG